MFKSSCGPLQLMKPRFLGAVLACLSLSACLNVSPPPLQQDLPAAWQQQPKQMAEAPPPVDLQGWWKSFKDPVLDELVRAAMEQNLGVAQAQSRLRQSRLLAHESKVAYLPNVAAGAHSVDSPSGEKSYLQLTLGAVWDLGLFGLKDAAKLRSQGEIERAVADVQAARVTVVAEIVRNYIELRAAQAQIDSTTTLSAVDDELVSLSDARIDAHLMARVGKEPVLKRQQQNKLALAGQKLAELRAAQALAVLLGKTEPDPSWFQAAPQPLAPEIRLTQVPADLLRTRPEIWRAEAEVNAAAGEAGIARAHLYPHVALGTSYLLAYDLSDRQRSHFDIFPLIGPAIDIPVFDFGGRKASSDAAKEALQAAVLAYRQTLVEAVGQTEVALAALNYQHIVLNQAEDDVGAFKDQAQRQAALIKLGVSSPYERALFRREQLQADAALIDARAAQAMAVVTLYKALGGAPLPDAKEAP